MIEAGLDHAEGGEILEFALRENRVCVTLDHDFQMHLALAKAVAPSVVFARLDGLGAQGQFDLIRRVWKHCVEALVSAQLSRSTLLRFE